MGPSEGRDVSQKVGRTVEPGAAAACDGPSEMLCVPVDDDSGEQIEACHTEVLAFGRPVADFALAPDAEGVFEGMMGLALVQTDLGAALHVGIEQPLDDEERALDPSAHSTEVGHRFHVIVGTHSTRSWAAIPRDDGRLV
jgi:hypothetical protein